MQTTDSQMMEGTTERRGQRVSTLFGMTLREAPGEAEIESHALLLRAGYVRQLAAGIYSYLPLAWRSLRKIEQILREEMDRIGGQEMSMPVVHPAELWQATGRWYDIDETMARFVDRRGRDMLLAMTHEESVAFHTASEVRSYRQLPAMIYHMQTKFRDELRSRGGLIRVREFVMKGLLLARSGCRWPGGTVPGALRGVRADRAPVRSAPHGGPERRRDDGREDRARVHVRVADR